MAIGDLSPDQQRFHQVVTSGTRLDANVVRAWIGCESGWGVHKSAHNYLNIGPGRSYASVDVAALATVSLIMSSSHYAGIRASVGQGGAAQVAAIKASPWDAGHYGNGCLDTAFGSLAGGGTATPAPTPGPVSSGVSLTGLAGAAAASSNPIEDFLGGLTEDVLEALARVALTLVFTVAAFALIALGLNRLTGAPARQRFAQVAKVGGLAAGGAGMVGAAAAGAAA